MKPREPFSGLPEQGFERRPTLSRPWLARLLAVAVWLSALPLAFAAEEDDILYRTLVRRVEGGDFSVDFRALRLACIKSRECEPRGTKADFVAMNRAVNDHDARRVIEAAEHLISLGFVDIEAHATSVAAYGEIHDPVKAKFHMDVTTALLRSIQASGDGRNKETAYEVICDREEYVILSSLGLPYFGSGIAFTTIADGGHHYDKWEIRDPKTGQNVVVFFNNDAFSSAKSRVGDK